MQAFEPLSTSPILFCLIVGMFSIMVGSFLNVVIHRLPIMMQRAWRKDCLEYLNLTPETTLDEVYNLVLPHSGCPMCHAAIKPYQNIPVISYILLKGKCAQCNHPISLRYPIIEVLTTFCSIMVAWRFGFTAQTGFALALTWSLIALSFIDIDHQLLPDSITLPVLWLGLFINVFDLFTDSHASTIGAILGYLVLWCVFHVFKLITGKEGMGYGDFKLLALFGAWLGWQFLPVIILLSSLVGAAVGITMIIFSGRDRNKPIPFGPYLAAAGWIALLWGENINQAYLKLSGF